MQVARRCCSGKKACAGTSVTGEAVVFLFQVGEFSSLSDLSHAQENDVTWNNLLTMEKDDFEKVEDEYTSVCLKSQLLSLKKYTGSQLEIPLCHFVICKIGITDPEDQQKVMRALQQMHLDNVDLDSISPLGAGDMG